MTAAMVQHVLVLHTPLRPERFIVPLLVGMSFGILIVALVNARAAQRASLEALAVQREEIAALNRRLSQTVRSQGNELKSAERRLVDADRLGAVGLLAGGLAHDFNNLLTVVLSGAGWLLEDADADGDEDRREIAETMLSAGERGATLTRQLLTLARPPRESNEVQCLNRAVEEMESLVRQLVGRDVVLTVTRCPGTLPVPLGRAFLEQVLVNLAVNGRDAMPGGGALSVTTEREGGSAVLRVRDTGTGMTKEVQARIFEPFFTTKGEGRGTGLGLAVVRDAMQRAGGLVAVESLPGAGTTFLLTLPLAAQEEAEATPPGSQRTETPRHILFVDGEAGLRRLSSPVLEQLGFEVRACAGQAEALMALDLSLREGPDVALVSDLLLADGDGLTLVHEARKRAPKLPVVVTSSFGLPEVPNDVVALAKPYTAARMLEALEKAVRALGAGG